MSEFIIVFRESLEAALIVGIICSLLIQLKNPTLLKYVFWAIASALVLSIGFAAILTAIENSLGNSNYKYIFEAILMIVSALMLLYTVVWLSKRKNFSAEIKAETLAQSEKKSGIGIFLLTLFAVLREGFETALFVYSSSSDFSLLGFVSGFILAVGLAYLMFVKAKNIQLNSLFKYSSIILVIFASGMMAYGIHEMEEFLSKSGYIDEDNITRVYDILSPQEHLNDTQNASFYTYNESKGKYYHVFHDKGSIGVFLKSILGYNSNPNWIEFLAWIATLFIGFRLYFRRA